MNRRHRALLRVARALPKGGYVLCIEDPAAASLLARHRDYRVEEAGGDAPLPFADRQFLAAVATSFRPDLAAELARVSERYLVVGGERLGHGNVERMFGAAGFRPLAREAELLLLRSWWVYALTRS